MTTIDESQLPGWADYDEPPPAAAPLLPRSEPRPAASSPASTTERGPRRGVVETNPDPAVAGALGQLAALVFRLAGWAVHRVRTPGPNPLWRVTDTEADAFAAPAGRAIAAVAPPVAVARLLPFAGAAGDAIKAAGVVEGYVEHNADTEAAIRAEMAAAESPGTANVDPGELATPAAESAPVESAPRRRRRAQAPAAAAVPEAESETVDPLANVAELGLGDL